MSVQVNRKNLYFKPDSSRVVARFFNNGDARTINLVYRIMSLNEDMVKEELKISNALKFSKPNVPPHIIIKSRIIKGNKEKHQYLSPEKIIVTFLLLTTVLALKKNTTKRFLKYFKDSMEKKNMPEQELVLPL